MSIKKVGWCRKTQELVLDVQILNIPYLRDDMDVYALTASQTWLVWTPETQSHCGVVVGEVPEVVQVAMMMLT
jgi:hypothetical protein